MAFTGVTGTWAQTPPVPDAGQVLRELQPSPIAALALVLQRIEAPADPAPPAQEQGKVFVKAILITGNQEIATTELQPLVAPLIGAEQSLTRLNAAARRLTAYYRRQGFAVARAYLPPQDITDGTVTIAIVEGRIASHKIDNRSRLSDERTQAYFDQVKDGDVIKSPQIDRGLLLLQDTPGVGGSRATLQPGASSGTAELLIEIEPAKAFGGQITADNHGNRYTGEYRLGGTFSVASPLRIGDELAVSVLTSGEGLNYGRLAYQRPVGTDGLRLGAAYFETRYKLGREFEGLDAHGTAGSASGFATYPFIRSLRKNLNGLVWLEDKRLKDYIDATQTDLGRKITVATLALSGSLQDALGGGGVNRFELAVARGDLNITSPGAQALDAATARTNGGYTRISYALSRLQRLTPASHLALSVNGQWAGKNLDSSEKISLGGINGVRAYPQGEAGGDEGWRAALEFRHDFRSRLQGTLFYDTGRVTANHHPFDPTATNRRTLSGAGVGLNASIAAFHFSASLAWRTSDGAPTSIPASAAKNPMLWLQAGAVF